MKPETRQYIYLGDKLTDPALKGKICTAVLRPDGKVIRGRNRNHLVMFGKRKVVVLGRRLRKLKPQVEWNQYPTSFCHAERSEASETTTND